MRAILILNEKAGLPGKAAEESSPDALQAAFVKAGIDVELRVPDANELAPTIRAAAAARPDVVVVGGGDGTVRCAAEVLAGTGLALGVLPLGTFNHFAKDLRLPTKLAEIITLIATGATRSVDVGEVNGHVFINNCSLGAYAEAVRRRDRLRARRGLAKSWAMLRASFEEFRRLRRLRLRIAVDPAPADASGASRPGRPVRTPVVVIGNNRYSGNLFRQNLRPRLDEGQLWLYTVHARRHLAVVRMMLQALVGQLDEPGHLAAEPAREILIESDSGPVPIAADGEVLSLAPPFHFRIRPAALRVIAPVSPTEIAAAPAGTPVANHPAAVSP